MATMKITKPNTEPQRSTQTRVDTILFTKEQAKSWECPFFQRKENINQNVKDLANSIGNDGGIIPGVLSFGILNSQKNKNWLIDGRQRRAAFLLSGKEEGYADVRYCFFDNMEEMSEEYETLNSHLVSMRPDDYLRGLEVRCLPIRKIREACPFVGYDFIRRGPSAPVLSMSVCVRSWSGSATEVPGPGKGSSRAAAKDLTNEDADQIIKFLKMAETAWGMDSQYARLWTGINMCLNFWLFRRTVVGQYSGSTTRLTDDLFQKCLMSVSANQVYLDWLVGRHLGNHDRAPAYNRLKGIFAERILMETGKKAKLPAPAWAHG